MRGVLLIVLLLLSSASQAVTLAQLQQRFANQPVVRADFSQVRHIEGMKQPLKSHGQMLIAQKKGLWWQQSAPFKMTLVLDDSHMVQTVSDQPPQIITAANNPQMFQFNHLLRALFQADRRVLDENFQLDFTPAADGSWQLALTPITSPLDKLFRRITLQGAQFLNRITLDDRQGDSTEITFSNQRITPPTLSAQEQHYFDF
ncbi:hypothetical protein BTJ39_06560 [Izhakiella australiensis]|uniref:Outer membrane lipoprotein carrier protein LolA n=1 Tax=Izhakiella australiensis TaxID=1926881 RepID=A0A1S8YNJ5_9GAMM|nr:outer membrane lipoprotein carrier protein LolA [Izhakiella australiensis]OON40739.1 hypothetical protein BTJ39_06560 [Izhakiella australiensis]